ncbi:MAG: hypothetical protein IPH11_15465 [Ignavibacteriales bacterium]|nr:hypothetical protein [Ignavibacteriales bacterium]
MDKYLNQERLSNWIAVSRNARKTIAQKIKIPEEKIDLQTAVIVVLKLGHESDLLDIDWTEEHLVNLVSNIDFKAWSEYEEVVLHESILPDGVPKPLNEETVKAQGEIWRIHRYDPDPFPFLPHAHNIQTGYKLDLRDGKLYEKKNFKDKIRRKDLIELRSRIKRIELPDMID